MGYFIPLKDNILFVYFIIVRSVLSWVWYYIKIITKILRNDNRVSKNRFLLLHVFKPLIITSMLNNFLCLTMCK